MVPRPRMGERVTYYISARAPGRSNDWQRARPLADYDSTIAPYDRDYYVEKLDEWLARYGQFLGVTAPPPDQGELAF